MKPQPSFGGEVVELAVISVEDVILSKLRWYKMGGFSEQQEERCARRDRLEDERSRLSA
jgi:hypothetical protein